MNHVSVKRVIDSFWRSRENRMGIAAVDLARFLTVSVAILSLTSVAFSVLVNSQVSVWRDMPAVTMVVFGHIVILIAAVIGRTFDVLLAFTLLVFFGVELAFCSFITMRMCIPTGTRLILVILL